MRKITLLCLAMLLMLTINACYEEKSTNNQIEILNYQFRQNYNLNEEVSLLNLIFKISNNEKESMYSIKDINVYIEGNGINLETYQLDTTHIGHYKITFSIENLYITFYYEVVHLKSITISDLNDFSKVIEDLEAHTIIYLDQTSYTLFTPLELTKSLTIMPAETIDQVTFNCSNGCFYINNLNKDDEIYIEGLILNNQSLIIPAIEIDGLSRSTFKKLNLKSMEINSAHGVLVKNRGDIGYHLHVDEVIFDGHHKEGIAIEYGVIGFEDVYEIKLSHNIFKNFNRSSKKVSIRSESLKEVMIIHNTFIGKTSNIPYSAIDIVIFNDWVNSINISHNVFMNNYIYNIVLYKNSTSKILETVLINHNNFLSSSKDSIHINNRNLEDLLIDASNNYFLIDPHTRGNTVILIPTSIEMIFEAGSKLFPAN